MDYGINDLDFHSKIIDIIKIYPALWVHFSSKNNKLIASALIPVPKIPGESLGPINSISPKAALRKKSQHAQETVANRQNIKRNPSKNKDCIHM